MSEAAAPPPAAPGPPPVAQTSPDDKKRFNSQGLIVSIITTTIAFLVAGLVVLATGHDPFGTYRAIFNGTGITWLIPGYGDRAASATNFQQTLLETTPLILCGLAVAFAFRCGMFNIGGQGQYFAGSYAALIFGSYWGGIPGPAHIILCIVLAIVAGAAWGGIAGFLKATTGAHEVISTIMLNWIAIWIGTYFFGLQGPFVSSQYSPISNTIVPATCTCRSSGADPVLQGLHIGFFIAIGALVVFWAILNRTTLGFEVRAVGFNPEAARYSGINVKRNYFLAMAISGAFAGLAGGIDILGWQFQIATPDILVSHCRLPRDRGRAARAQQRGRRFLRGAPLRRAHRRYLEPPARPERVRPAARGQPDADHPGARRALRRRRPARALDLEVAQEARLRRKESAP